MQSIVILIRHIFLLHHFLSKCTLQKYYLLILINKYVILIKISFHKFKNKNMIIFSFLHRMLKLKPIRFLTDLQMLLLMCVTMLIELLTQLAHFLPFGELIFFLVLKICLTHFFITH